MALTTIKTGAISDDAVTEDKIANAINTARAANTAKDLTALSASNLTSGTVPDARFPATLPAASAANLTSVPAANITGTLPAISATNLTNVPAANITGTLPAISGANLTNLPAGGVARNLIINGAMNVAQRSAGPTISTGFATVDRWQTYLSGQDEVATYSQADVASGTTPYTLGFRKCFKIQNGNQTSGDGASDYFWMRYIVESQDIATSGWNYVSASSNITLSFWVKSSVAKDFKGYLRSRDGTRQQYSFATGSLSANTWTKITKTIPGNSNLQFDTDTEANAHDGGLDINISTWFGSTYSDSGTTENAWATYTSGTRIKDYDSSSWWTTDDATFEITGIQLEVGDSATDFAHKSFAEDLALCRRYYFKPHVDNSILPAYQYHSSYKMTVYQFPVQMRAVPTCVATWGGGSHTQHDLSKEAFKAYVASAVTESGYYMNSLTAEAEL